jgi:hypothetical protein
MDSASTQNMDYHMVAPVFSSSAPCFSPTKHNLPSDGVFSAFAATISAAVAIPSFGNESLSLDVHSLAAHSRRHNVHYPGNKLCKRKSKLCMIMVHGP